MNTDATVITTVALIPVTSRLIAGEGISIFWHYGLCRRDQTDNDGKYLHNNCLVLTNTTQS